MKECIKELPEPFRGRILERFTVGSAGAFLLLVALVSGGGWTVCVLCTAVTVLGLYGGISLLWEGIAKRYVVLEGICTGIERTKPGRDGYVVWLHENGAAIKIISRGQRLKGLSAGDTLAVYIAEDTPVYDMGQYKVAGSCLVIERKEGRHDEG